MCYVKISEQEAVKASHPTAITSGRSQSANKPPTKPHDNPTVNGTMKPIQGNKISDKPAINGKAMSPRSNSNLQGPRPPSVKSAGTRRQRSAGVRSAGNRSRVKGQISKEERQELAGRTASLTMGEGGLTGEGRTSRACVIL